MVIPVLGVAVRTSLLGHHVTVLNDSGLFRRYRSDIARLLRRKVLLVVPAHSCLRIVVQCIRAVVTVGARRAYLEASRPT